MGAQSAPLPLLAVNCVCYMIDASIARHRKLNVFIQRHNQMLQAIRPLMKQIHAAGLATVSVM